MGILGYTKTKKEAVTKAKQLKQFNARMRKQSPETKAIFQTKIVIKKAGHNQYGFKYAIYDSPVKRKK